MARSCAFGTSPDELSPRQSMVLEELLRLATTRGIRKSTKVLPEAFAAYMQHYVPFERTARR